MIGEEFSKELTCGRFVLTVPSSLKINRYNEYDDSIAQMKKDLSSGQLSLERQKEIEKCLVETQERQRQAGRWADTYSVEIGSFKLHIDGILTTQEPGDLKTQTEDAERRTVQVEDAEYAGIKGKVLHDENKDPLHEWWLKKDDCLITFSLVGPNKPSSEVLKRVESILETIKFLPER